ncbi:porin family protein [Marinoscillum furvescens]|uniref:Outer membrane protein with beta-barrel domain n=1 Tax=Marinoscillum furvescens DSM 4134 TaxID=1122208 RepID=A0A3D9KVY0_MARFU|nr:porin family protein [Marinoscillum furvescens]RED91911.1 outer membrane protein with beta-barrel domain [Marinoscillum furvescens DSM 4134]
MKLKAILLCVLVAAGASMASAQKAGLKGGVNFTNLYIGDVDDVDDENMKVGFNAGLYYRADINEGFAIQPEFLFTQKGTEVQYDGLFGGSGRYRFNLNYLEVPVLAVGKVGNFNIHAGPYLGFLVGAKVKDVDDNGNINDVENLDRDDFNTLDTGVAAGFGLDFDTGTIGLRYSYGFQEIGKGEDAGQATEDSKNSALQLFVGFDF